MDQLKINLKNCYGIRQLNHTFDFSKRRVIGIYAANGVMKTSFANTFYQISLGKEPEEKVYSKKPYCEIKIDDVNINKDQIFVIKPYISGFESRNMSTLLINPKNKEEYDKIYDELLKEKSRLIVKLNKLSGIKKDEIENQILKDFDKDNLLNFFKDLELIEIDNFSNIKYDAIFNNDVLLLLKNEDIAAYIKNYIEEYNKLFEQSKIFRKGVFNPSKADTVITTLAKENFFKANHKIKLEHNENLLGEEELKKLIEHEKKLIVENEKLKKIESEITRKLSVKAFQDLIAENPILLNELESDKLDLFRRKLWISYFLKEAALFQSLVSSYKLKQARLEEIEREALTEKNEWSKVFEMYKIRFFPPYEDIEIVNKKSAILGKELPQLIFKFKDIDTGKVITLTRENLEGLDILSQGEKRALYILNILFEIEAKKKENQKCLFIIDDVADSFDYKNKYAIIQYLKEMSEYKNFYLIILTHNFDFFRTIQSKIEKGWKNYYLADNTGTEIILEDIEKKTIINPFKDWKEHTDDDCKLIASIPFIREIIRYTRKENSDESNKLTSLLHYKKDSESYKIRDLEPIFKSVLIDKVDLIFKNPEDKILDRIFKTASEICLNTSLSIQLEHKVVLSIAIRLQAEKYMWNKIMDKSEISENQTGVLYQRFRKEFESDGIESKNLKLLESVVIMTPENIHLNSFMYEPILDMGCDSLKKLYQDVNNL